MKTSAIRIVCLAIALSLVIENGAMAHAFLDHAEPRVGAKLDKPPTEVKIWFTGEVEPDFSVIEVYDGDGNEIDKKDTHIDPKDPTLLIVSLPEIHAGVYRVSWHVVASDTHKTHGDFKFEVKS